MTERKTVTLGDLTRTFEQPALHQDHDKARWPHSESGMERTSPVYWCARCVLESTLSRLTALALPESADEGLREALLRVFDLSAGRPDIRDIARAALSETSRDRTPATTWLVERGQPEGQVPTVWWMDDGWTDVASEARRYTRAEAETVIARKFTPPPSRGRPSARAVEHMFFESHTLSETSHD